MIRDGLFCSITKTFFSVFFFLFHLFQMISVVRFDVVATSFDCRPVFLQVKCIGGMVFMANLESSTIIIYLFKQMPIMSCIPGSKNNTKFLFSDDIKVFYVYSVYVCFVNHDFPTYSCIKRYSVNCAIGNAPELGIFIPSVSLIILCSFLSQICSVNSVSDW